MTETQKRIKAYQKSLPHMKERVMAVAMLLVIAITVMVSSTFAWITLSRAPEVAGLATTIATNGNLEIALSDVDGLAPDVTAVGDGAKDILQRNLTWGNLVNLAHENYGLQYITLRPSVLNTSSLEESPLYAVTYGADGRIDNVALDFAFTNYKPSQVAGGAGTFVAEGSTKYGVRAISSVKATSSAAQSDLYALTNAVSRNTAKATMDFQTLYNNRSYIDSITKLAGVYITYRINDTDQDCSDYISPIYKMMVEFDGVLGQVGETVLSVANLQHFMYCDKLNSDEDPANDMVYTPFTLEQLRSGTVTDTGVDANRNITLTGNPVMAQLLREGFQDAKTDSTIMALKMYVNAHRKFQSVYTAVESMYTDYITAGKRVGWEALREHINVMANIYTTTIDGIAAQSISADNIGSLTGGGVKECVVHSGLLADMDQMLGTNMVVTDVSASVTVLVFTKKVDARVTTAAQNNAPYQLLEAGNIAKEKASGGASSLSLTATDTYGMAIDFWVRTNSANSLLTLEGEMITQDIVVGQDQDGNDIIQTVVVGYKGANRVWEENDPDLPIYGTSATQGSGSCYVFYPESPEDQDQSLKLLEAMCVAFLSEDGTLLAQADMDTANVVKDGGRVLVPMKLRAKTVVTEQQVKKDENGNIIYKTDETGEYILDANGDRVPEMVEVLENSYHITPLQQNQATRITAVVYLDGARLTNSQVLAASAINGQMNIQFGTSEDITALDQGDLKNQFYNITVRADRTEFDAFDPDNKPVVNLTMSLQGMEATTVQGNFVTFISDTQGAKQPAFSFAKTDAGWKATVTLNGAGKYQLRSVQIDGVDYPLSQDQIAALTLTVPGTTVDTVECPAWGGTNEYSYKSANNYYNLDMLVTVSGTAPRTVQGVFTHADGQNVTLNFVRTNNGWEATGKFTTSGTYEMTYMIIDGVYVPLVEDQCQTLTLQLGLNAQVFISAPVNTEYKNMQALLQALDRFQVGGAQTASVEGGLTDAQKTLADRIIDSASWTSDGATHLTEQEKSALKAAIAAETFASAAQKTLMQKAIAVAQEALLEELYSDADNCLNLQTTAEGYSMLYSGGDLFMDVYCIITDDKGAAISGFNDVDLYYGIGTSQLNRLTAMNMTYNRTTQRYEGSICMSKPGLYSFQQVVVDEDIIDRASSAPMIRAISPKSVEYVGKSDAYTTYYENIGSDTRYMDVVLKESASAAVGLELTHTDDGVAPTKYLFTYDGQWPAGMSEESGYVGVYRLDSFEQEDGSFVYRANVPTDGTWKITGMLLSGIFYKGPGQSEGVFYDGVVTEGGTGWLNFTDKVVNSNIETTFLTTVNLEASADPDAQYNIDFMNMETASFDNMTIKVTDYLGRAIPDVEIGLTYTHTQADMGFETNTAYTNLPNRSFGSDSLPTSDGITFEVGDLNFQLQGTYVCNFSVKIGGVEYNMDQFDTSNGNFRANDVRIAWNIPNVTITEVTPSPNTAYSIDMKSGDDMKDIFTKVKESGNFLKKTVTYHLDVNSNHIPASQNTEYITKISANQKEAWVYFKCMHTGVGRYVNNGTYDVYVSFVGSPNYKYHYYEYADGVGVPSATLTLSNMGAASTVKLEFVAAGNGDVLMYKQYSLDNNDNNTGWTADGDKTAYFEWTKDSGGNFTTKTCKRFLGYMDNENNRNDNDKKTPAGTLTATHLIMVYGGVEYKIRMNSNIILHNDY